MDDEVKIVGYHGTRKENATSICKKNFKINNDKSNKLFLGAGVYFFYKIDDALDWNIKQFKNDYNENPEWEKIKNNYAIIESKILVNKSDILDLDEKESLFKLEMLISKINKKLETIPEFWKAQNKTSAIINYLYSENVIARKVIVKTFFEKIGTKKLFELQKYPRKMFCVKDISIIKENSDKIKEMNEELFESIMYFYD